MNDDTRMIDNDESVIQSNNKSIGNETIQSEGSEVIKDLADRELRINQREANVSQKEEDIAKHESVIIQKEIDLEQRESSISELEKSLKSRKDELDALDSELAKKRLEIVQKEQDIGHETDQLAQKLQIQEVSARTALEGELAQIRADRIASVESEIEKMFTELGAKIEKIKNERLEAMSSEVDSMLKKAEVESSKIISNATAEAQKTIQAANTEAKRILDEANSNASDIISEAKSKKSEVDQQAAELEDQKEQFDAEKKTVARDKRRIQKKQEELDELEQSIEAAETEKIKLIKQNFTVQLKAKDNSLEELRQKIESLIQENEQYASYSVSLGSDPAIIERKFQEYERVIKELRDEISSRASMDVQSERDLYKQSCEELTVKLAELQRNYERLQVRNQDLENLEITNQVLTNKNEELQSLVQELQDSIENYKQRIERLSASEARLSDREARIAEINKGYLPVLYGAGLPNELSETDWLQNIYTHCNNYGITFPRRILYAFHTALKISDWSSITVLAGVSGTGKSELPKLYAAFGGMNFINVPVQPSWDSQESMLGFFNSIDNRFEPEPLLRFLVQCTENPEYSQYMSIVLLDEMNLAHVEHYFADFLSKLETRRGTSKNNVPTIEVKLGAGVEPYQLKLERSLLWTGTMNQDETTKSLSDKVLDRGLVINFPRPRTLSSRKTMAILDKLVQDSKRPMLLKKTWGSWIVRDIKLEGDQLKELEHYKKIVEDINNALEYVGRALGHRVWQSIEYYILNYPPVAEVINKKENNGEMSETLHENMKIAFEDQIVQKIMPKLRGVETRGKSKESLDKIESLLEDNGFERLKDDFDIACEQGYGQFIWSSAKYIEADEEASNSELDENQDLTDDTVDSEDNSINEAEYTPTTAKDDE